MENGYKEQGKVDLVHAYYDLIDLTIVSQVGLGGFFVYTFEFPQSLARDNGCIETKSEDLYCAYTC